MNPSPRSHMVFAAAAAGTSSVALGLGVGYLLAPAVDRSSSPLQAVGSEVIDRMPERAALLAGLLLEPVS